MDAKGVLRLIVQHRFWILVGVAALFPIIGYFVTAGGVVEATEKEASKIEGAQKGAQGYAAGIVPNGQYTRFTSEKIDLIEEDFNSAWRRLYAEQADLLDWPVEVEADFKRWGREYPEDEDPALIRAVRLDYTNSYEDYAEKVYETFRPWDSQTGEGVVEAPPMPVLLQTAGQFDPNDPPTLTKIWQFQENLWVRRAILEVIADVNERAQDWEAAPIKQIRILEVGNREAVDHRSLAEGTAELQESPPLGGPEEEAAAAGSSGSASSDMAAMYEGYGGSGDEMDMGMIGGGMSGGAARKAEPVRYLQPEGIEQYRVYPAFLSVLIDQNAIHNLMVAFENSPMSMQVMEINWARPSKPVTKPVKGKGMSGFAMGGYGMGMGGGLLGMGGYGYGYEDEMDMGGMGGFDMGGYGNMRGMGAGYGEMGGGSRSQFGTSSRGKTKRELGANQKAEEEPEGEEPKPSAIFDPYYNIVELQVYVQARFYNPPPPAPEEPASPGDSAADPTMTEVAGDAESPAEDAGAEADPGTEDVTEPGAAPDVDDDPEAPAEPADDPEVGPDAPADPEAGDPEVPVAEEPAGGGEPSSS